MDRQEAYEKLEKLSGLSTRTIERKPTIELLENGGSSIDGLYLDTANTFYALNDVAGIPNKFLETLTRNTLGHVAHDLWPSKTTIVYKENDALGIVKGDLNAPVETDQIFDLVERVAPNFETVKTTLFPKDFSAGVELVVTEAKPIKVNDLVRGGVMIRFSPVGTIKPQIYTYASRLVCTNGAISTDKVMNFESVDGSDFNNWFSNGFETALNGVDKMISAYKEMSDTVIPENDRAAFLNYLINEARLGRDANKAIRIKAINEPIETMWDAYNLTTWATSHAIVDPHRAFNGMRRIGSFVTDHSKHVICPFCHNSN